MFRVFALVVFSLAVAAFGAQVVAYADNTAGTPKIEEFSPHYEPALLAPDPLRYGKQPSGLSETTPRGSAADEVRTTRIKQSESSPGSKTQREPLTSIISANAEMVVEKDEVNLDGLKGLTIEVRNNTDRPLIFYGDKAIVTVGGAKLAAVPKIELENIAYPVPTLKGKTESVLFDTAVAGSSIGGVPAVKDIAKQSGPVLNRYGGDELRREDEVLYFGKRIVWPGDHTSGVIFFKTSEPLTGAKIDMPVSSLFDTNDQASLSRQH